MENMPDAEDLEEELETGEDEIDMDEIEEMSIDDLAEDAGAGGEDEWDSGVDKYSVIEIPIQDLTANNFNPNEMSSEEFDRLVENIEEDGYLAPIQATPKDEDGNTLDVPEEKIEELEREELAEYLAEEMDHARIVGGEHRWSACKVVGMTTIPTILVPNKDEEWEKMATVRMNAISGDLDPIQFAELVEEQRDKYDDRTLKRQLGFAGDETLFDQVLEDIKESVPDEVEEELEEEEDEIQTIDDLSEVLNRIFRENGEELDYSFISFSYGGEENTLFQVEDRAYQHVEDLKERIKELNADASVFWEHYLDGAPMEDALEAAEDKAEVDPDADEEDVEETEN